MHGRIRGRVRVVEIVMDGTGGCKTNGSSALDLELVALRLWVERSGDGALRIKALTMQSCLTPFWTSTMDNSAAITAGSCFSQGLKT